VPGAKFHVFYRPSGLWKMPLVWAVNKNKPGGLKTRRKYCMKKNIMCFMLLALLANPVFTQGLSTIQYLVFIVEDENNNMPFLQKLLDNYAGQLSDKAKLSVFSNDIQSIRDFEEDIAMYGNNLHASDGNLFGSNGIKHGRAWALLARLANEKNIDLDNRSCYIDSIIKDNKHCIAIRIY
jgi:hypothetical protein